MKYKKIVLAMIGGIISVFMTISPLMSGMVASADPGNGGSTVNNCNVEGDCTAKTAFAFNCGGGKTGVTENVSISCLTITVLNFLSIAVGIAVVGGVTVGGIRYAASSGSPAKRLQAVSIITNSVLGLVLYFLAWAIINFLIPGGVFKP